MHPFTSLALWLVLGTSSLLMPFGYPLLAYSLVSFLLLILMKSTRHRWRYVAWIMLPMAGGLWLVHSGWLAWWLRGRRVMIAKCSTPPRSGYACWRC